MTELHDLRLGITAVRLTADGVRIQIHDLNKRIKEIDVALGDAISDHAALREERGRCVQELADATAQLPELVSALEQARTDYAAQAAAEPPLWPDAVTAPAIPLLLLPVRLEAVHQQTAGSTQLLLRVYPDDVHVDAHEEALTDAERTAGEAYWTQPNDDAWRLLVRLLGPARAAWTREALRPGSPAPERREHTWSRAAHTTLLPDRFVFSAYDDTEGDGSGPQLAWRQEGKPIPDLVKIGFPPNVSGGERMDRLPWDADTKWLVDFEAAVDVGLAISVPLPDPDVTYTVLTAVGISGNTDATTAADRWQATLQAHQYGAGLAFLPVGTPTNNTPGSRSGWRSRPGMPAPATVDGQRAAYDVSSDQAAARAATAFGIDGANVLAAVPDALDESEGTDLRRLHAALGRYFAQSDLLRPYPPPGDPEDPVGPDDSIQPPADVSDFVAHYERWVRSRGTLPTLRVGNQPYGLLPASALDLWRSDFSSERLHANLSALLSPLELARRRAVQVGAGVDQDGVILDLLSRMPASVRVKDTQTRPVELRESLADPPAPMLVTTVPDGSRADHFRLQRENESLVRAIQTELPAPEFMKTLPFTAARERFRAAEAALAADPNADVGPILEDPDPNHTLGQLSFEIVQHSYFEITATATTIGYLALPPGAVDPQAPPPQPDDPEAEQRALFLAGRARAMREVADPLIDLEPRVIEDPSGVDRLLLEVFDSVAHRFDAWYTSLAAARLAQLRTHTPIGLRTGAYGLLTDVHDPGSPRPSDGYIVAPSMHHATTAAVLRSGFLAHSDKRALAVDIQSWRVRAALGLLDGVRTGQPLSVLLGYRFERGLHDAKLDRLIDGYRKAYPLRLAVAPDEEHPPTTLSALSLEARNVVDGQRLRSADRDPFMLDPRPGDNNVAAVVDRLVADLDDTVDALADLLLAESVHHLVGGNPLRAGLSADAIGRGDGVPQEIEVVRTPRSANAVAHHVGVLASASRAADPGGWSDKRPLAMLEPALEAWCRVRLGSPAGWRFGTAKPGATAATGDVGLDALGWCALDVVTSARTGVTSPLARALAAAAGDGDAVALGDARLGDLVLLCEQLRAVAAGGTALLPGHLDPADPEPWSRVDLGDLRDRAAPWVDAIVTARDALSAALDAGDGGAVSAQLTALADLGIVVGVASDDDDPIEHGRQTHAFLERVSVSPIAPPPASAAEAEGWARAVATAVASVAGDHLTLLPRLRLALPDAADAPTGADHDAIADWLRNLAPVRPGVAALADALAAGEILGGGGPGDFAVAQMPAQQAGTAWVGTAPAVQDPKNPIRATIVLHRDGDNVPGEDSIAGLVADSFSEAIPVPGDAAAGGPLETLAAAFHHDRPGARAPQALLLAAPPDTERGWCMEDIHGVVEDTLWLARVRATDLDDLPELRQLFPLPAPD